MRNEAEVMDKALEYAYRRIIRGLRNKPTKYSKYEPHQGQKEKNRRLREIVRTLPDGNNP